MKISIAWLFDHINADWNDIDIANLVDRFNKTTAEIERYEKIKLDLDLVSFAQVTDITDRAIALWCPERNEECSLPARAGIKIGDWLLIIQSNKGYRWASMHDMGSEKDHFLPPLYLEESLYVGDWKKACEATDYVLEVDNKSITNRPDLWGHRGFAREIAAIFDLQLKPLDSFLSSKEIAEYNSSAQAKGPGSFSITIQDTDVCKRFAGLHITTIERKPSLFWMAHRLARLDSRPIDTIIDITNYVMLDISQPMHAFDANKLKNKAIIVRRAQNKEKLTLIDGDELALMSEDIVVCDGKTPVALGGVMGGYSSEINPQTKSVFLEAAHFDATTIRRTATRHKKRTEASARFEKNLDPNQNISAIARFLQLCDQASIKYNAPGAIISLGAQVQPVTLEIEHNFIEKRLGVTIAPDFIMKTLQKLAFGVVQKTHKGDGIYHLTIPSFRATKDIECKEDIVEEVGRFFGYDAIPLELPDLKLVPSDIRDTMRLRAIKKVLVHAGAMREINTYSFYDESFLRVLSWEPKEALSIQNPISENLQRLITSLVPNLFKAIEQNSAEHDQLRFFEWARTWHFVKEIEEQKVLAGIIFDQKNPIDFYTAKALVQKIFDVLRIDVTWKRIDEPQQPWFAPYQSAYVMHEGTLLGTAGIVHSAFLSKVSKGYAFVFELNGNHLLAAKPKEIRYEPISKYPEVERDVSMLIPLRYSVDEITRLISNSDKRIVRVELVDFFQKKEWQDQKSLTFRFVLRDPEKTLTKEDVDHVCTTIHAELQKRGATIR
ncbi:MAG: phenylalanine--tRNA ligase subunit beta [bacterium]|nr:phenylalanine--tRNA ligase subunit beta [bacterium]